MSAFDDFDGYLSLERVTELALSADGSRLVATVAGLNDDGNAFVSALWEIDPRGANDARRLTRSERGESGPVFAADGSLLFTSRRGDEDDPPALWRLPAGPGEAHEVLAPPGGVSAVAAARETDTVVLATGLLPGSTDADQDAARRAARKDAKTSAVLYTQSPVRLWDHDLGPDEPHLHALAVGGAAEKAAEKAPSRELTPTPGRALEEAAIAVTPDGGTVITTWQVLREPGMPAARLAAIDTATGGQRIVAAHDEASFTEPAISRDGGYVVCTRTRLIDYDTPPAQSLWLIELATGTGRELVTDPDIWPGAAQFSADGTALYFLADAGGHRPIFRLDLSSEQITQLTRDGHFAALQVAGDGTLYALRDHVDEPPTPVRVDPDGTLTRLPAPGHTVVPGHIERVGATAADGTQISGWLALPEAAGPHPLLLWIHGGPLSSWNGWSWRWNPWLMIARGYAVLLPDPAFSTGYGARMIERGWGEWGGNPYTDLMTITDAVVARADIDQQRTAAMGGSYGGYMANWVAGHTDRFRCIVTHASLWALEQFQATTDFPGEWIREWGLPAAHPERYEQWSPHRFLDAIRTPMLVIHGDKDYRVPIAEGVRLWSELQRAGVESKYLYFADEGHWVLKPGNARVWYETVWAWLAQHVLDEPWTQPGLL
jgi:dipeptidyl aminopeptidase/acylaminoacyl peptidase